MWKNLFFLILITLFIVILHLDNPNNTFSTNEKLHFLNLFDKKMYNISLRYKVNKYFKSLKNYYQNIYSFKFEKFYTKIKAKRILSNDIFSSLSDLERKKFVYLIWLIKENEKIEGKKLTYLFYDNKELFKRLDIYLKKEMRKKKLEEKKRIKNISFIIGNVTYVGKPFHRGSISNVEEIPLVIRVIEAIGKKEENKNIDCSIVQFTKFPYEYIPAIGDTVLAFISTQEEDTKKFKNAICNLITNGFVYKNRMKNFPFSEDSYIKKEKYKVEEFKIFWKKIFEDMSKIN